MGIPSISSLANMEYALYGNRAGLNMNAPSFTNGYRGQPGYGYNNYPNYNNPAFRGYQQNDATRVNNTSAAAYQNVKSGNGSYQTTFGAIQSDINVLADYYSKQSAPSESMMSATIGGGAFALLNNTRLIAHPWNSLSTVGKVEKMFAGVKDKTNVLYDLWKNPDRHKIITDAYARMHKLEGAAKSRLGLFKSRLDKDTYELLKNGMKDALESGDTEAIALATEKIRVATGAKTGYIPRGWRWFKEKSGINSAISWVKGKFGISTAASSGTTVAEKLADETALKAAATKNIAEKSGKTLTESLKHSFKGQGGVNGLLMMGIEFLMDWSKIKSAFSKDNETGMKQLGQTTVKGAGTLVGWAAGEAVGSWAGAWAGMKLGTLISPGVGTVIGAVAGLIGGSIGCALMGKVTHAIVGKDVGEKVELANLKSTPEGQVQLLQQAYSLAQNDKKLDPRTAQAIQNVATFYGATS